MCAVLWFAPKGYSCILSSRSHECESQTDTTSLGVPAQLIAEHGAVSRQVAAVMALGCRAKSGADFALSTTGIAGPTGGTPEKPIGLVYIGLADAHGCRVEKLQLDPTLSRDEIRQRTAESALRMLETRLQEL